MAEADPLVSCLCLTYARPEQLREAIWCFLQQDWPNKELVVLNDHPEPLHLDRQYPGVRLYNLPERFPNLGAKRNFSVSVARGDYLFPWDDDDLYLPWRISESMGHLLAAPDKWAFKPTAAWMSTYNRDYTLARNAFHSQLAMRRAAFDHAGGYPEMNSGQDIDFESRIPADRWIHHPAPVQEMCYVYRWADGCTHISGFGVDQPGKPTSWERIAAMHRNKPGGVISPGFRRDYWRDLATAATSAPGVDPAGARLLAERLKPYHRLSPAPMSGGEPLKRVLVVTTFADLNPDYSLATVVADQLRMLVRHGYSPGLVVQENFADEASVPEGVRLLKVMPVLPLHDYRPPEPPRPEFADQAAKIAAGLRPVLGEYDVALTHDLVFLGWYLPHNAAIRQLAEAFPQLRWLHWVHSAPSGRPAQLTYPHDLRYSLPPNSKLVYLNSHDTLRLAEMFGTTLEHVRVVHNAKDPGAFFGLHPAVRQIVDEYQILSADVVAVFPFSTPRWEGKNVKKLIWLMAKIKEQGRRVLLVLANAHCNAPAEKAIVRHLQSFAVEKGLAPADLCFTSTLGARWEYSLPNEAVRQLFQLSNVFIMPSLSECCSLVLLEAAICKNLLVLNADVPSMREFGGEKALYPQFGSVTQYVHYQNEEAYWGDWARIILGALAQERALGSFRQILSHHSPDWIFKRQLEPLLYEPEKEHAPG
ncbi:MAG TPA: glycosyltransferase [Symbiobacteriaceae bacterium]|nr:glycosyltransferase [Symbiobacteriaceae bacterium]